MKKKKKSEHTDQFFNTALTPEPMHLVIQTLEPSSARIPCSHQHKTLISGVPQQHIGYFVR